MKKYKLKEIGPHSQGHEFYLDSLDKVEWIEEIRFAWDKAYEVSFTETGGVVGFLLIGIEEWRDEDGYHKEEHWFFLPKYRTNKDIDELSFSITIPTEVLEEYDEVGWDFGEGRADKVAIVFDNGPAQVALKDGDVVGPYEDTDMKLSNLLKIATKSPELLAMIERKEYEDYSTNGTYFVDAIKKTTIYK